MDLYRFYQSFVGKAVRSKIEILIQIQLNLIKLIEHRPAALQGPVSVRKKTGIGTGRNRIKSRCQDISKSNTRTPQLFDRIVRLNRTRIVTLFGSFRSESFNCTLTPRFLSSCPRGDEMILIGNFPEWLHNTCPIQSVGSVEVEVSWCLVLKYPDTCLLSDFYGRPIRGPCEAAGWCSVESRVRLFVKPGSIYGAVGRRSRLTGSQYIRSHRRRYVDPDGGAFFPVGKRVPRRTGKVGAPIRRCLDGKPENGRSAARGR